MPTFDEDTINAFIDWLHNDRDLAICNFSRPAGRCRPTDTTKLAKAFLAERN